jgi:hypothetical protein
VAIQPANHQVTCEEFKAAFREHYIPEGVLHMKQEEFMKLKQGGDTVNQYLNKFNHLSQYAIDQVNTDLKKKNCFMRGLSDRLQRKMAACIDLTYGKAISTTLSVEAKYAGSGKNKGFGGEKPNQGQAKRQRFVIRPSSQNRSFSRPPSFPSRSQSLFAPTMPPLPQISRVPRALDSLLCLAPPPGVLIVASRDISSKTAHIPSRINQMLSKDLGSQLSPREIMWGRM